MQVNNQPAEKPVADQQGRLDVVSIWPTIQGEGPFAGSPAVFIRLAGCNLQCPACDTDYTSERSMKSVEQILKEVEEVGVTDSSYVRRSGRACLLIVLTGGEPFRQQIIPLCDYLIDHGHQVQIETNGTLSMEGLSKSVVVVCSPKSPKLHESAKDHVSAWKYVLDGDSMDPETGLPKTALGGMFPSRPTNTRQVFLQPLDEQNETRNRFHLAAVVRSCLAFGYRLCIQTHKLIGVE